MSVVNNIPHWEDTCRALANTRARQEEISEWNLTPGDHIPYRFRWEHVCEVVRGTRFLAAELQADTDITVASAWLHDICKTQPAHGVRGAEEAQRVLAQTNFPQGKIPAVAHALQHHVGLFRPRNAEPLHPLETAILWDADKLSKLGIPQIAALLSSRWVQGKTLPERHALVKEYVHEWIDRTAESMNTGLARTIARVRYQEMLQFVQIWQCQQKDPFGPNIGDHLQAMTAPTQT